MRYEDNETLTRVGPGTPMGSLLRRYWAPACLSEELPDPDGPPIRVKLLGEPLVAFRDSDGRVGLLTENCAHRGTSLFFGRNEECGLRCAYHGWKWDVDGNCVDMASEPEFSRFKQRVSITAYPTHESGGIVWTYMGPRETMTPFRDFGTDSLSPELFAASREPLQCNWVQALDGELDTSHISNLHRYFGQENIPDDGTDRPGYPSNYTSMRFWATDRRPRLEIEDTWYGFRYAGLRTTPNGHTHVRVSALIYPFSALIAVVPFGTRQIIVMPSDDYTSNRFSFNTQPSQNPDKLGGPVFSSEPSYPYESNPNRGVIERRYTAENNYLIDRGVQQDGSFSGIPNFKSQDIMATESAGPLWDRTREHLGTTDIAVAHFHEELVRLARDVEAGKEPPAIAEHLDYRSIRSAEKILEDGEDWRILGTNGDPTVQRGQRGA